MIAHDGLKQIMHVYIERLLVEGVVENRKEALDKITLSLHGDNMYELIKSMIQRNPLPPE